MRRKWSSASKVLALLAVVTGAAAFLLVRGYVARLEALRPAVGPPVDVLVAAQDLARGTELTASMVSIAEIPAAFAPPGALATVDQVESRTLASDLSEGEILTGTRLGVEGAGPVASLVPPGLRAFAVGVALPAASVEPGDRVDVLATFGGGRPHTETVATGLEVLMLLDGGAGDGANAFGGTTEARPSLVLLVSPDQAERLAYARAFGDLAVSIEGPEEVMAAG